MEQMKACNCENEKHFGGGGHRYMDTVATATINTSHGHFDLCIECIGTCHKADSIVKVVRPEWPTSKDAQPVLVMYQNRAVTLYVHEDNLVIEMVNDFTLERAADSNITAITLRTGE